MTKKERPSTIKEVARHAGVSIATVSYTINQSQHVSTALCSRVRKAIKELGYRPNYIGRALRNGKSRTVALILPDIVDPFFPEVTKGIGDFLRKHGYNLFLCNTDEDPLEEQLCLEVVESRQVDGVIIAPAISQGDTVKTLAEMRKPTVVIDRGLDDVDCDQVFSDNSGGTHEAISYLLGLGHRKIGIIHPPSQIVSIRNRLNGYREALEEHGIEVDENLICEGDFGVDGGHEATKTLLERNSVVSAIFFANDSMTLGAIQFFREKGIKYPEDLSIVAFDDPPWARVFVPTLTVVAQQTYRMGWEAAHLLWSRLLLEGERQAAQQIKLETFLRIRESAALKS